MAARISITREQYLDSIRQVTADATNFVARFSMIQLTWQPAAGERWNILECLDHIAISNTLYLDAMQTAIGNARSGTSADVLHTAGLPSTKFVQSLEPPPRRKSPAPLKLRPRPTLNPERILPEFLQNMDRVTSLITSSAGKDLNSVRFRNPVFPLLRFTVSSGLLILAAHARRHMWQAGQVVREPDFPR